MSSISITPTWTSSPRCDVGHVPPHLGHRELLSMAPFWPRHHRRLWIRTGVDDQGPLLLQAGCNAGHIEHSATIVPRAKLTSTVSSGLYCRRCRTWTRAWTLTESSSWIQVVALTLPSRFCARPGPHPHAVMSGMLPHLVHNGNAIVGTAAAHPSAGRHSGLAHGVPGPLLQHTGRIASRGKLGAKLVSSKLCWTS